jgi:release factor glutamine methyltransferase
VLDMGTGCGILGILAAARACRVVAVDVNPYAVRCARDNAEANDVRGNMAFIRGDLLTNFRETAKFDVALFNAPYLPTEPQESTSWLERAWAGGTTGRQIIDRFVNEVPAHLKRKGRILLMQSTLAGVDETVRRLAERGLKTRCVAEQALPFFERVVLLEAGF